KVTQPDLIRFLFCPLVEVSQQSIVFHEIASVKPFLFFWRAGRRSAIHSEHARLHDYGKGVMARDVIVPREAQFWGASGSCAGPNLIEA
ncbi:MAG: hypothetical protein VX314_01620, partial [Pseudomonadota bacterium]|nr:hypothetical protein [Pseudomonadota bacterium]